MQIQSKSYMDRCSQGKQPFNEKVVLLNILAPAVVGQHLMIGISKNFGGHELNVTIMCALTVNVEDKNPPEAPNQQIIKLEMTQWQLEFVYAFH